MNYSMTNTRVQPVVLRYRKTSSARWLSHLDLIRALERAIRRARLPIMYSEGFNPRPRMSFGPPLPLGATSDSEIVSLRMREPVEAEQVAARLNTQMPDGLEIISAEPVGENQPVLPPVRGSIYVLRVVCRTSDPVADSESAVRDFLSKNEVIVERPDKRFTKRVDIRPSVEELEVIGSDGQSVSIQLTLSHAAQNSAKPTEVVKALSAPGREIQLVSIHRKALY